MSWSYQAVRALYYRFLRPHLPRRIGLYNGIPARAPGLFDRIDVQPEWEQQLIQLLRDQVQSGDTVVIVGGGFGVSSVWAAQEVGPDGQVIVYEASQERFNWASETLKLNSVGNIVDLRHALVGPEVAVKGAKNGADAIPAEELPECDVLVLDCEGSETEIIMNLSKRPHGIVVETHSCFDAPKEEVIQALSSIGYSIEDSISGNPEYGIDFLSANLNNQP